MAITPAATAEVAHATLAGCHRLRRRVQTLLDRQILIGEPSQAERDQLIESILKWHLVPTLGPKRLDAITNEQVQRLKLALANRAPKTVNNVLTVLSTLLKRAVEWGERSGCRARSSCCRIPGRRWGSTTSSSTSGC